MMFDAHNREHQEYCRSQPQASLGAKNNKIDLSVDLDTKVLPDIISYIAKFVVNSILVPYDKNTWMI
jgi:hypothetical protein